MIEEIFIIKRNGKRVPFSIDKIKNAVLKAFASTQEAVTEETTVEEETAEETTTEETTQAQTTELVV